MVSRKIFLGLACLTAIGLLIIAGAKVFHKTNSANSRTTAVTTKTNKQLVSADSRILIMGDVFWGRQYEKKRLTNETNALQFPFSGLGSYDKPKYDSWLANLECPITTDDIPFQTQWDAIALNCKPEFMPEFAKWFDIVSLANNHMQDIRGNEGYESTKKYLDQYYIQYFGSFYNSNHQDICKVVKINIKLHYSDQSSQTKKMPLALCGYHNFIALPTTEDIAVIKEYSDKFLTIAFSHMGTEYTPTADNLKTAINRQMIDAGADLVAGGHPHWVQNSEVYKGKLIVYSLGNFIFDQQGTADVQKSVSIDMTMNYTTPEQLKMLNDWLKIEPSCKSNAKCQEVAKNITTKTIGMPKLTYDLIPGKLTNLVQSKANSQVDIDSIMNRTNWAVTKKSL